MKKFIAWCSEEQVNKIGFTADSAEQAQQLLDEVIEGKILMEDLPGYWSKAISGDYELGNLQEVSHA
mgnify:CR=1 FL=1